MEERVACAFQAARSALHVDAAILAVGSAAEARQIVEMEVDVVGDHQIDEAVAIIVAEGRAG